MSTCPQVYKLTDDLLLQRSWEGENALEALEDWLEKPLYRAVVSGGGSEGVISSVARGGSGEWEEITKLPAIFVPHVRELMWMREKSGRFAFYFAKLVAGLSKDDIPNWVQSGANTLAQKKSKAGKKESKNILANWRRHLAEYILFQSKLLRFYANALDRIVVEAKSKQPGEEAWTYNIFVEYIVRNRWGAWDLNKINDDRWSNAQKLHPLHPDNKGVLGEQLLLCYIDYQNLTYISVEQGGGGSGRSGPSRRRLDDV